MTAPDMIGHHILDVRYHHLLQNPEGIEEFRCYLQLSNDTICTIPVWPVENPAEDFLGEEELWERFTSGDRLEEDQASKIITQKIVDIYFQEGKGLFARPAVLELENGYYLTEKSYGSDTVGVQLLDKGGFLLESGLKSYKREIEGK